MKIEHKYFPGFLMDVLEERPCENDGGERPAYKVIDPESAEDWLCSRDVAIVEA